MSFALLSSLVGHEFDLCLRFHSWPGCLGMTLHHFIGTELPNGTGQGFLRPHLGSCLDPRGNSWEL